MGSATFSGRPECLPCMLRDFIKLDNLSFFLILGKNTGSFPVDSKWKKRLPKPSFPLDAISPYTWPSEKGLTS